MLEEFFYMLIIDGESEEEMRQRAKRVSDKTKDDFRKLVGMLEGTRCISKKVRNTPY